MSLPLDPPVQSNRLNCGAVAATLVDGVLQVTGTGGNDVAAALFEEDRTANGQPGGEFESVIVVKVNNQRSEFDANGVKSLVMQGGGGNDSLEVLHYLTFDGIMFDRGAGSDFLGLPATILGGDGRDTIAGSDGNSLIDGGGGSDRIIGRYGNDLITGRGGNDYIEGGHGRDTLIGNDGNDLLSGGSANNVLYGSPGNDTLSGGAGNDVLLGNGARDTVQGTDDINGGAGRDTIFSSTGGDNVIG